MQVAHTHSGILQLRISCVLPVYYQYELKLSFCLDVLEAWPRLYDNSPYFIFGGQNDQRPTIMEKINGQTPKNGVVFDTTSNVQPI